MITRKRKSHRNVNCRWFLQSSNKPLSFFESNFNSIDTLFDSFFEFKSNCTSFGYSNNFQLINFFRNIISKVPDCIDNAFSLVDISLLTVYFHSIPCTRNWGCASRSSRRCSCIKATRPSRIAEIAIVHKISVIEHDYWNTFRSLTKFMMVAWNRWNSFNWKIEVWNICS